MKQLALEPKDVFGNVTPPAQVRGIGEGAAGLSSFFTTIIELIYLVAAIIFIFMVVIGAVQIITSGGDKEAVSGARRRITYAIIGIVVLALVFVFARVFGQITGFEFFKGANIIPTQQLTVDEYERRKACNALANTGFRWDQTSKQCVSTN